MVRGTMGNNNTMGKARTIMDMDNNMMDIDTMSIPRTDTHKDSNNIRTSTTTSSITIILSLNTMLSIRSPNRITMNLKSLKLLLVSDNLVQQGLPQTTVINLASDAELTHAKALEIIKISRWDLKLREHSLSVLALPKLAL